MLRGAGDVMDAVFFQTPPDTLCIEHTSEMYMATLVVATVLLSLFALGTSSVICSPTNEEKVATKASRRKTSWKTVMLVQSTE